MKCAKDTAISLATVLVILGILSGMVFDQLGQVRAEQDENKADVNSDIDEIKQDIKEIKNDIKEILKKG